MKKKKFTVLHIFCVSQKKVIQVWNDINVRKHKFSFLDDPKIYIKIVSSFTQPQTFISSEEHKGK